MIIRLSKALSAKLKEPALPALPPHANPFLDWHAHLFTHNRAQYIIISNSTSLFSIFMHGAGILDYNGFLDVLSDTFKDVFHGIGAEIIFSKIIVPGMKEVRFAKSQDKRVIGSMNELVFQAKVILEQEKVSPYELSLEVNERVLTIIGHSSPKKAFLGMKAGGDSQD